MFALAGHERTAVASRLRRLIVLILLKAGAVDNGKDWLTIPVNSKAPFVADVGKDAALTRLLGTAGRQAVRDLLLRRLSELRSIC